MVNLIKSDPKSRRMVISAWNPNDIPKSVLPPCHYTFQFNVTNGKLDCISNLRSADIFLGIPFDIVSYSILTILIAKLTNLQPGNLVCSMADTHLYNNHQNQAAEQIKRTPKHFPQIEILKDISSIKDIENLSHKDFNILNYNPDPPIKADMAI